MYNYLIGDESMDYRTLIFELICCSDARILEIGPLNRPLVEKKYFPNTIYCDIRSTEDIKKLYCSSDYLKTTGIYVDTNTIVEIDTVLGDSYKSTFEHQRMFDYVVASHVVEHMEDILYFFQDIAEVITDGGKVILYYPDSRYSFDHFRAEASLRDAYDVYVQKKTALARMVFDFFHSSISENNPSIFWAAEELHKLLPNNDIAKALSLYEKSISGDSIDDVHYWPFSDAGFIKFLYDSVRSELISFECTDFFPTMPNTQEFVVVLQKAAPSWNRDKAISQLRGYYATACSATESTQNDAIQTELLEKQAELDKQLARYAELEQKFLQLEAHVIEQSKLNSLLLEKLNKD